MRGLKCDCVPGAKCVKWLLLSDKVENSEF